MNNTQFRKLMLANPEQNRNPKDSGSPEAQTAGAGSSLGSRHRNSIPMTPRAVAGSQVDFARQLAERNKASRPQKSFKTSAPKGIKLAQGYVDRARNRTDEAEDDREARLKALEESFKKEEIDRETYENLRFKVAGGDLSSTHLVKGLDFKLLERIRKGEDVYEAKPTDDTPETAADEEEDVDDAFDELESREVEALSRDKTEKKKGQLSNVPATAGKKRTRDQILADLKAARAAAKESAEPALGDRFRKIGTTQKLGTRIEKDSKGREVLIIVDADGHEKRKVRKLRPGEAEQERGDDLQPDKDATPLGMEVPEIFRKPAQPEPEEDEDVNIFDDAGDDYDPLAGMDDSGSESGAEDENADKDERSAANESSSASMAPPPKPVAKRDYFKDAKSGLLSEEQASRGPSMSDPSFMAAIKKAASLHLIKTDDDAESDKAAKEAEERRKKMVQMASRDDDDLDMGFGTSRFEDEEDSEDHKLSAWGGGGGDDEGNQRSEKSQRKRGPKKRKGDANNAADVLRVMEARKKT